MNLLHKYFTNFREAVPGDFVAFDPWTRLESVVTDKDFDLGGDVVYCLCIGRVAKKTMGLTIHKVYLLSPSGVGFKRYSRIAD